MVIWASHSVGHRRAGQQGAEATRGSGHVVFGACCSTFHGRCRCRWSRWSPTRRRAATHPGTISTNRESCRRGICGAWPDSCVLVRRRPKWLRLGVVWLCASESRVRASMLTVVAIRRVDAVGLSQKRRQNAEAQRSLPSSFHISRANLDCNRKSKIMAGATF